MSDPFESAYLDRDEADYVLPITEDELRTLKFALSLMEVRAQSEDDESTQRCANILYNRVKRDGLIEA